MSRMIRALSTAAVALTVVVAAAQGQEELNGIVGSLESDSPTPAASYNLQVLQELARKHNPTLAQARAATWQAYGRQIQAGAYPNPVLAYVGGEIGQDGRSGQQGFQIQQKLITANKLGLSRGVENWRRHEAQQAYSLQQLRVDNGVRREFYQVVAAQRLREIAGELVVIAKRSLKITNDRRERQEGNRIDQLQAVIELQRAELAQTVFSKQLDAAWRELESVVGTSLGRQDLQAELETGIPDLNWDLVLTDTLNQHPGLQRARLAASRAKAVIARAKVEPIPNVTVQAGSQYDAATDFAIANVQVSLPLPVYNRNRGNIMAAQADWIRASKEVKRLELKLQKEMAASFLVYESRRAEAIRYHDAILPAARETLELSEAAFQIGELTYIQLLTTQRTYMESNREYVIALSRLWEAAIHLEGRLASAALEAPQ